jgi:hypothetical protein
VELEAGMSTFTSQMPRDLAARYGHAAVAIGQDGGYTVPSGRQGCYPQGNRGGLDVDWDRCATNIHGSTSPRLQKLLVPVR